jgi:hypothetical protein
MNDRITARMMTTMMLMLEPSMGASHNIISIIINVANIGNQPKQHVRMFAWKVPTMMMTMATEQN